VGNLGHIEEITLAAAARLFYYTPGCYLRRIGQTEVEADGRLNRPSPEADERTSWIGRGARSAQLHPVRDSSSYHYALVGCLYRKNPDDERQRWKGNVLQTARRLSHTSPNPIGTANGPSPVHGLVMEIDCAQVRRGGKSGIQK
jgi:hypothetical protein